MRPGAPGKLNATMETSRGEGRIKGDPDINDNWVAWTAEYDKKSGNRIFLITHQLKEDAVGPDVLVLEKAKWTPVNKIVPLLVFTLLPCLSARGQSPTHNSTLPPLTAEQKAVLTKAASDPWVSDLKLNDAIAKYSLGMAQILKARRAEFDPTTGAARYRRLQGIQMRIPGDPNINHNWVVWDSEYTPESRSWEVRITHQLTEDAKGPDMLIILPTSWYLYTGEMAGQREELASGEIKQPKP